MISKIVLFTVLSLGPFSMPVCHQDSPKLISDQFLVQNYGFLTTERQNNFGFIPKTFIESSLACTENSVPLLAGTAELPAKKENGAYKRQKEKL